MHKLYIYIYTTQKLEWMLLVFSKTQNVELLLMFSDTRLYYSKQELEYKIHCLEYTHFKLKQFKVRSYLKCCIYLKLKRTLSAASLF